MLAKKVKFFSVLVLPIITSAVTMSTTKSQSLAPTQYKYNSDSWVIYQVHTIQIWENILNFLFTFHLRLGPACCKSIIDLSETCLIFGCFRMGVGKRNIFQPCLPKYWETSPPASFAIKTSSPPTPHVHLGAPKPVSVKSPTTSIAISAAESQPLAPAQLDKIQIPGLKCWPTLVDIEGCKAEILNFVYIFQLRLGPACCKAIIDLSETCFPAVFSSVWGYGRGIPFKPAYPNVVKGYCASITGGKTSPPALNHDPPTNVHHN
ncbi:hypothetical protein MKW92_030747 [Papaver armeniacum]|nr:hypothetical protein MKW92_030747 [Papaver armeniacum]